MKKISITGVITFIGFIAVFCGLDEAKQLVVDMFSAVIRVAKMLPELFETLLPFMGFDTVLITLAVFAVIVTVLALRGYQCNKRRRKKVLQICGDVVDIASTVSMFASAKRDKTK